MSITVYYQLSSEGQRAALLAGVSAAALQSVEVPADPYWIERATIDAGGKARLAIGGTLADQGAGGLVVLVRRESNYGARLPVIESPGPLTDLDLHAWSEEAERIHQEDLAAREAAKALRNAQVAESEAERNAQSLARMLEEAASQGQSILVEGVTSAAEGYERLGVAAAAREAEKKAAAQAIELAWIKEGGSPRLRRIVELGLGYGGLYRDERLAAERPGWIWEVEMSFPFREKDAYLPTLEDLDDLDRATSYLAHTCDASPAVLRRVTVYRHLTDEEQSDWQGPEKVDSDGDIEIARGHAIKATFLGQPIWLKSSIP